MSDSERRPTLARYSSGERTNHWLIALGFVLAALSGLALFHPALFWLGELFGGGPWTPVLHPFIGLFMLIGFLPLPASPWGDNRMQAADWPWPPRGERRGGEPPRGAPPGGAPPRRRAATP